MNRAQFGALATFVAGATLCPGPIDAQTCSVPCVGPARGAVIAAGGGKLAPLIYQRFVELAGGEDARIVLIPTAGTEFGSHDGWTAIERLRE
ncbi:MAG: hypothetical protein OEN56_04035, partial [Gemmatimonadota bacterium]|nr:hypothetical protein [Gemmatimonadota bacterium]